MIPSSSSTFKVTDNPKKIWSSELDNPTSMEQSQKDGLYGILVHHLKRLVKERDDYAGRVVEISLASPTSSSSTADSAAVATGLTPERSHLALEVSESKAKIRKLNQLL